MPLLMAWQWQWQSIKMTWKRDLPCIAASITAGLLALIVSATVFECDLIVLGRMLSFDNKPRTLVLLRIPLTLDLFLKPLNTVKAEKIFRQ